MTFNDLVATAKYRLTAGNPGFDWQLNELDLAPAVDSALQLLATQTMLDDTNRGLLQQSYSVTLTAGVGDLLAATGSVTSTAGEILMEGVAMGSVMDGDGEILQPLAHLSQFYRPQPQVFSYYYLAPGGKIWTRTRQTQVNGPNDIQGVNSPLTVLASYVPASVTSVPSELENDLVEALCSVVLRKIKPVQPEPQK